MTAKAYLLTETALEFKASAGDVTFTPTSLAATAGRQSAEHDFGAAARAANFTWRAYLQFATAPVVGQVVDIYAKTSDGTHDDNDDGATDAAVSAQDKLRNLYYLGSVIVDEASTTPEFSASGQCFLPARYFQVVWWNATDDALSSTAADNGFILEPWSMQAQAT